MHYEVISAGCHVDLCWLPSDLLTANASAALRDRMPYVTDGPDGKLWTTKRGASLGVMNGMRIGSSLFHARTWRRTAESASASVGTSIAPASTLSWPRPIGMMPPPGAASAIPPRISSTRSGHSSDPPRRRSPTNS